MVQNRYVYLLNTYSLSGWGDNLNKSDHESSAFWTRPLALICFLERVCLVKEHIRTLRKFYGLSYELDRAT